MRSIRHTPRIRNAVKAKIAQGRSRIIIGKTATGHFDNVDSAVIISSTDMLDKFQTALHMLMTAD